VSIAHIAAWTRDIEAAAQFWRFFFDCEIGPPYQSARRPGFVSIFVSFTDGPSIELMTGPWVARSEADSEREGWVHIAISVGSVERVDRLAERLSECGLLVSAPHRTGDGFYEAVARAPDGILVEIAA
jgi:lactoylglutathione lyase